MVRYARSAGGIDIAWQEFGNEAGPRLVCISGFVSHLELNWEFPPFANMLRGLGTMCRVLAFDKRGTGLSSRDLGFGSLAERADDVTAVMDAAGWERAHLYGVSEGGPMAILVAATDPDRVESLSLYGSFARLLAAPDYPIGRPDDIISDERLAFVQDVWGTGVILGSNELIAHADEAPPEIAGRFERNGCTPQLVGEILRHNFEIDIRSVLPAVHVPTLVLHASGDPIAPVAAGRYVAEHIDGARYVEFPADIHGSWRAEDYEPALGALLEFVAGSRPTVRTERMLATVMFTDIVESTRRAAEIGDRRWRSLLDEHDRRSLQYIQQFGGTFVKHTGDGVVATFDGPARAVQCAQDLRTAMAHAGLPIRAGLHTGEIERRDDDLVGIGVHLAARVAALANANEVLVSRTVRDLVIGSDLQFEDRGIHELKGVPDTWQVYAAS
jgi:class 3 adenylate cyclase